MLKCTFSKKIKNKQNYSSPIKEKNVYLNFSLEIDKNIHFDNLYVQYKKKMQEKKC